MTVTATTKEIPVGEPFSLAERVVGLVRETGDACFVERARPGPPGRIEGYTVGVNNITGDSPHNGELHPDADELLYLISGAVDIDLELESGDRVVPLAAGQAIVVPRGTWHLIRMREPGQLINITPGPGGDHRPL
jgi:mannose-6-phosphate isomerase-like protein (cupin superfamily)